MIKLILIRNIDFIPYSQDSMWPEEYQRPPSIPHLPLTVSGTEHELQDRQNLTPDQWCSFHCFENRPMHVECICCCELRNMWFKIMKGLCVSTEEDFTVLLLAECVLWHLISSTRENLGCSTLQTEWPNRQCLAPYHSLSSPSGGTEPWPSAESNLNWYLFWPPEPFFNFKFSLLWYVNDYGDVHPRGQLCLPGCWAAGGCGAVKQPRPSSACYPE